MQLCITVVHFLSVISHSDLDCFTLGVGRRVGYVCSSEASGATIWITHGWAVLLWRFYSMLHSVFSRVKITSHCRPCFCSSSLGLLMTGQAIISPPHAVTLCVETCVLLPARMQMGVIWMCKGGKCLANRAELSVSVVNLLPLWSVEIVGWQTTSVKMVLLLWVAR